MSRNLLVCLDGTHNEPETGYTNVARLYAVAVKDSAQLAFHDPGVGTMGARAAITPVGKAMTRVAGLIVGYGIKENIEEAYHWLMEEFQAEDRIFIFGFSRGAYTALALTGMLRTVGLLRRGADNLIPYAMKLYAQHGKERSTQADEKKFWRERSEFNALFGNPDFPDRFDTQVAFLGLWDTVKSVGWLNARARFEQARWPFTRIVPNIDIGRLALAIDEKRRPYHEYRFDPTEVANRPGLAEMWFAGVHSDVGGGGPLRDGHRLSNITLAWMADEAIAAGLRIDAAAYEKLIGFPPGTRFPDEYVASCAVHENSAWWILPGLGWHHRTIRPGDHVHPSVRQLVTGTAHSPRPYRPDIGQ